MFIRFVISHIDSDSGRRQGLFQAGDDLLGDGCMAEGDAEELRATYGWFKANLAVPTRFSLSARPHAKAQAISWFRDTAAEHVRRMQSYQRLLQAYGLSVIMLRTARPGYIVYEDDVQVVAYPFADTPC
ncbi:hypothetical protein [Sphingomonas prati]|uniref:Uncharacterized protein n=2 Tax=Sphingomonas prati TaxID=1843237 RepID=A0A7W9BPU9_9SPHN|nr:hypothetical protein [Sphingomonas prati]MBB5727942.1 hypothetical protein [Sphingomonas prati]